MRTSAACFVFVAALPLAGQAPALEHLSRIDGGLGGIVKLADGGKRAFHVEASGVRARLIDARMPTVPGAHELAPGSDAEAEILSALEAWFGATFTADEQKELLALERLPDARTQEEDFAHQRAELLRTVRRYVEITRPKVSKVFAGRATVSLSLQLQLADSPPQQILWRRLGKDEFARLHIDTQVAAVEIDSRNESRLLLGLENWLAKSLGSRDALWQPEPKDIAPEVHLVLRAYRGYLDATSPRLRTAGTIIDAGNGGSHQFEISDAKNNVLSVRFDHALGTKTPGRLFDGPKLVDLGSARELELLGILRRAAERRRGWKGAKADDDWALQMLESELDSYRSAFEKNK